MTDFIKFVFIEIGGAIGLAIGLYIGIAIVERDLWWGLWPWRR